MEKQEFEIPKGCTKVTVEQIGNTIVTSFESEKYIPKVGDCVKSNYNGFVCLFEVVKKSDNYISTKVTIDNYKEIESAEDLVQWNYTDCETTFEKITPEQLQSEFNKLGYEYNFETHEATKIKWKPKVRERYYFINSICEISSFTFDNTSSENKLVEIGNCYRTKEEAEPRRQYYLAFKD